MLNISAIHKYTNICSLETRVLKTVCNYNKSFMFVRVLFPPESTETFVYKGDMLIKN